MQNLRWVIYAEHLCKFDKVNAFDTCIAMIFLNQSVCLKDVVREGFRIVFVKCDQSISFQNVTVSATLCTLLQIPEVIRQK